MKNKKEHQKIIYITEKAKTIALKSQKYQALYLDLINRLNLIRDYLDNKFFDKDFLKNNSLSMFASRVIRNVNFFLANLLHDIVAIINDYIDRLSMR